ncbi:GNAT family N-acetyltransferase [Clostridium gasigenes]|uniref:GNAT family N-acetyltransferase n=1 Tax=Clostridium gasigenes TaxID=94869 RepID=UPI00209AACEC|nr:GNAT family N-acetyltransferase [Clostridium gasigenes]
MESLAEVYNEDKVLVVAGYAHMYVACIDNKIVGCGSISSFWGKEDESILLTIFVLPEMHNKGMGRKIIETLELDEYFLRAKRIEIPASITACEFYKKMGYDYKDGITELDDEGNFRLEKFR